MILSIPYNSIRKPLLTIPTLLQKISICDPNSLSIPWLQQQMQMQMRWMTRHRRVQDRSKWKRVQPLENTTERWKLFSKILFLLELLKKQREQIITLRDLSRYRQKINLPKPFKISDFLKKSPRLFELYKDRKGLIWCGLTQEAEELMEEHERLQKDHNHKLVEYVSRLLMMSVDKRIAIDKIAHFRRDLGLPDDFRKKWVRDFPQNFRVVEIDDVEYLELTSWNPKWAVTELEKKRIVAREIAEDTTEPPGILPVPFPLKFPANYRRVWMFGKKIKRFQETSYLSPYADPVGLIPGTSEFDKRAVAVMHELLSFTLEKRLVVDHLTHFRREFVMPQRLMRLLLKHIGIFYVSEKGKRFNVFLTEAYKGSQLITKCPLVQWNEKLSRLAESRPREGIGEPIADSNIPDENEIPSSGTLNVDQENFLEFEGLEGDSQMNITEIEGVYASDEGMQLSFDMAVEPFQC